MINAALVKTTTRHFRVATDNIMNIGVVKDSLEHLKQSAREAKASAEIFKDDINSVSEKANVSPAVLRAFVNASISDKYHDKRKQADQLCLLFEEVE